MSRSPIVDPLPAAGSRPAVVLPLLLEKHVPSARAPYRQLPIRPSALAPGKWRQDFEKL